MILFRLLIDIMNHDVLGDGITKEDVSDIVKVIEAEKIPDSVLDKTIKISTWNIRNFGGGRDNLYLHYIADVLSRFELTAITELKENTQDLEKVMKILGPYWKVIYSDSNMDQKGNRERICYLYDGRVIEFTGLVAEADPIRENFATKVQLLESIESCRSSIINDNEKKKLKEILLDAKTSEDLPEYLRVEKFVKEIKKNYHLSRPDYVIKRIKKAGEFRETHNWWRSPYLASFKSGKFDFVMLAAHVRWGDDSSDSKEKRTIALGKLADWIKKRRESEHVKDKDIFVLGDFNIPEENSPQFRAISKHHLKTHPNILGDDHGSSLVRGKRYDQIFYHSKNNHRVKDGGVLNLFPEHDGPPYSKISKKTFKYKISDHFPLWIQLNVQQNT